MVFLETAKISSLFWTIEGLLMCLTCFTTTTRPLRLVSTQFSKQGKSSCTRNATTTTQLAENAGLALCKELCLFFSNNM